MNSKIFKIALTFFFLTLWGLVGFEEGLLFSQSTNQNYIVTTAPSTAVIDQSTLTDANSNTTIQYFDGLARPVQSVQKAQSSKDGSTWVDLVDMTEYDGFGRENKQWLPVPATGNTGAYISPTEFAGLSSAQYGSSEKPYSLTEFEPSPLNRVTGKYGAGASWYDNKKKESILYQSNAGEVAYFFVNSNNQLQRNFTFRRFANFLTKRFVTVINRKANFIKANWLH